MKKIISYVLAAVLGISALPQLVVGAAEEVNNSVSGYMSLDTGVKLIGKDKTAKIYVDANDYESVQRAAQDMQSDLSDVSGGEVILSTDAQMQLLSDSDEVKIKSINPSAPSMTIDRYKLLTKTGKGIIAVYNADGTLDSTHISIDTASSSNGVLHFEPLSDLAGKKVKGFLWEADGDNLGMTPLANSFTYKELTVTAKPEVPEGEEWSEYDIIVGTLGESAAIDSLAASGAIDISAIKGKWESFTAQENGGKLIIAGSDKRGTIYGIYDFCEKIGVSPWAWWADAKPETAEELYINMPPEGYTEDAPSVKYRGIFLNDEYNLNQWSTSMGDGNMNSETYEKIFELILRLKANTLWPAMHKYSNCFHSNPENAVLADKYGVVMGSSHAEPLLRNNLGELDAFQDKWESENPDKKLYKALKNESGKSVAYYWTDHDGDGNQVDNKEFLTDYWRESVKINGAYENIYTLGMRGVHDGSFQTNMDYATALNEIIAAQRQILKEEIADKQGISIEDIPQVFIPYKDIQSLYNGGKLKVPDDVTIMWTDDNYGYVRQNADDNERARAGRTGIYYHVSYYGYPTSYLWLSSTQPGLIREELKKSYDMGADKIWILNVGDLKPAEKEIEYFTRLSRNVWQMSYNDISSIYDQNAKRDFNMSDADAKEYAKIMDAYYEIANAKRPEFLRTGDFSVTAYGDEGERYINRYKSIVKRAESLYEKLPENKKASFFELALYPIRTAANMAINYVQTDRAKLYTEQGRGAAANRFAAEAKEAVNQINADLTQYNSMLGGKWNKIMNNNPSQLQGCDAHITTDLNAPTVTELDYTELAVMTDSQTEYSDNPSMTVSAYDSYDKFIDVINKGYGELAYEITSDSDALVFDKTSGVSYGSDRVHVSVDKSKAAAGVSNAVITVSRKIGEITADTKEISVTIENPSESFEEKTYIETGGVVSLEAEHYTLKSDAGEYKWQEEKDFGRSGNSMKVYPEIAANVNESKIADSAAYMEYKVYFTNTGTYTWDIYRMPTLNERGNSRFAVSLDGGKAVVLNGTSKYSGSREKSDPWSKGVLCNSEKLSTSVNITEAGYHTLRIYNVATGVVIDKMTLSKDKVVSYFGAIESYNTTYNTEKEQVNTTREKETDVINKKYEPKAVVCKAENIENKISNVEILGLTNEKINAYVAVAGYDKDGKTTSAALLKTEIEGKTTVETNLTLADNTDSYAVYVFDNMTDMQLIAPYKIYGKITSESEEEYIAMKSDFSDCYGKKSLAIIADCEITEDITADNIKYIYGEELDRDSYKYIPFGNEEGKYYIRVGVVGHDAFDEIKNTAKNITPDTNGEERNLNAWNFDTELNDTNGANPFIISGAASLTDGKIKMNTTSSGSASFTYDNPVIISQGETLSVEFDINFGKLTGKNISYSLTDANGNSLVSTKICAYNITSDSSNVMIGNSNVMTDALALSGAISKSNNVALSNKPTHFKNVIDFAANKAMIYIGADGMTPVEYTGKLTDNSGSVQGINFTTNYNNNERACYVDNVSVNKISSEQYKIDFAAVDGQTNTEIDADIVVKDGISGAVLTPLEDGTYMLCEGGYIVTAVAPYYSETEINFELSPATESKEVKIMMRALAD